MALVVYPPELNQYWLVSSFQTSRLDRRIVAKPSRGRSWYRRGSSVSGGRPVSAVTMELISGVARFWRFWDEDLVGGTLPFKVRDQQIDGQPAADEDGNPLLDGDGNPLLIAAFWVCRFDVVPDEVPLDGLFWQLNYQFSVYNL